MCAEKELDLVYTATPGIHVPVCLVAMKKGKHLCLPFVSSLKLATVSVSSETELAAHLDGELMIAKRFEIQVLPGKFLFRY